MNAESPLPDSTTPPLNNTDYDGEYGDGYLVGTGTPYDLWIWSRSEEGGFWFNWGLLNAPSAIQGPDGPEGPTGPEGQRGSRWYSQSGIPSPSTPDLQNYDQALDSNTGNVYQYVNGSWQPTGQLSGPKGDPGQDGAPGPQGIQGERGFKGDTGDNGQVVYIQNTLQNEGQLPDLNSDWTENHIQRTDAYLIPDSNGNEHIWLIIGTDESNYTWHNAGTIGNGSNTNVTIDGVTQPSVAMDYVPKISINYQIGDSTNVTSNGSEVTFSSLQTTGQNVTNEEISGLGVIELPISSSTEIATTVQSNTLQFKLTDAVWNKVASDIASTGPVEVQITAPTTSTNGTLTAAQLATLQGNQGAYLKFNNEIFRLQDVQHEDGYLVYSHVGFSNNTTVYTVKCITITVSTRGWVLTETQVGGANKKGLFAVTNGYGSGSLYTYHITLDGVTASDIVDGFTFTVFFTSGNNTQDGSKYFIINEDSTTRHLMSSVQDGSTNLKWKSGEMLTFTYYNGTYYVTGGYLLEGHPVDSIYESYSSTNPQTIFGGTWASINGRFLVGYSAGTNNPSYIGSYSSTVTYKKDDIVLYSGSYYICRTATSKGNTPSSSSSYWTVYTAGATGGENYNSHDHTLNAMALVVPSGNTLLMRTRAVSSLGNWDTNNSVSTNGTSTVINNVGYSTEVVGEIGSAQTDNMPPYVVVYMWRRTA